MNADVGTSVEFQHQERIVCGRVIESNEQTAVIRISGKLDKVEIKHSNYSILTYEQRVKYWAKDNGYVLGYIEGKETILLRVSDGYTMRQANILIKQIMSDEGY